MKYNDIDLKNWKESKINTDSLWVISGRDKSGKHKNIYHGNFIPQIPNQLIQRYTKKDELVFEPFMGSGTTAFECETLDRKYIGIDIIYNIHDFVKSYKIVCENTLKHLDNNRYFALVIGDVYKNSEVIPLGFYLMDMIKRNVKVKFKGTIIKNIEGNRGKLGAGGIWRYRALSGDYYEKQYCA